MQKKYRVNENYLQKLEDIKKHISTKIEYVGIKIYESTVIKIIIDFYYSHMQEGYVDETYIQSLKTSLNEMLEKKLDDNSKIFQQSLDHFKKETEVCSVLLSSILKKVDSDESVNLETRFIEIAKEIVEEELNGKD